MSQGNGSIVLFILEVGIKWLIKLLGSLFSFLNHVPMLYTIVSYWVKKLVEVHKPEMKYELDDFFLF